MYKIFVASVGLILPAIARKVSEILNEVIHLVQTAEFFISVLVSSVRAAIAGKRWCTMSIMVY